jgi:hypothetical protein
MDMPDQERRRRRRYKVDKPVTIRDGSDEHNGRLTDISSGGAAVNAEETDSHFDDEQSLELELDDFGTLPGNVVRTLDDGFAVEFDLDEDGEERLISEITGIEFGRAHE